MSDEIIHSGHSDGVANNLFPLLTADVDFTPTATDFSQAEFQVPSETDNPLYTNVTALTEEDLTDRTVGGAGLFDGLMDSLDGHLQREYAKGRLTGEQYASAYVQLTQSAMSNAVQYLLSKDQSFYSAQLAQQQARAAEVAVIEARISAETAKLQADKVRADLLNASISYANGKMQLSIQDAQHRNLQVQKTGIEAENDIKAYQLSTLLPAELAQAQSQKTLTDNQAAQVSTETSTMIPAQVSKITADTAQVTAQSALIGKQEDVVDYELASILPQQLAKLTADTTQVTAQTDLVAAQEALADYELLNILPKQSLKMTAEISRIDGETAQTASAKSKIDYEVSAVLPAQVGKIGSDTNLTDAQTSKVTQEEANLVTESSLVSAQTTKVNYETTTLLPAQKLAVDADAALTGSRKLGVDKDTEVKTYELTWILPAKLEQMGEETGRLTAQKNQILYETSAVLPERVVGLEHDNAIKVYQHDHLLPAEKAKIETDTAKITYEKDNLLPAQLDNINEQMEGHRAKTMDTRSDGLTTIVGSIGKQKELQDQQINSYVSADQTKFVKLLTDTWITQKTLDENFTAPTSYSASEINASIASLKTTLSM